MSTPFAVMGAVIVLALAQLLLQRYSPAYAVVLSIGAAIFLLLQIGTAAQTLLQGIVSLSQRMGGQAFSCLLRCAGILLLTDYARTLCEESGADSLGWCAGFAGRCLVLIAAYPLFEEVCQKIWGLAG